MNILQVSAPKTGSFWLNTILKTILKTKNIAISSYIKQQPVYTKLKEQELSFKGQADVDMIDIQEDGFFYRVSSIMKKPVPSIQQYADSATLAWTHSTWCTNSHQVFDLFDKKVCIIRDPRDRALSSAKFAFTPYMQQHYPSAYTNPEEYLNAEFENLMDQWVWFYGNYLLHKDRLNIHFVCYENLLNDFDREFDSLLNYLNLSLDSSQKIQIAEAVSFQSMKQESPKHLQKGKSQKWISQLSPVQQKTASEKAGPLMEILNYPLTPDAHEKTPGIPKDLPKQQLEEILANINWQTLY